MEYLFDDFSLLQEQLRRRKEEEDRIAQENEFLRASLRGSRKLQALQDGPVPQDLPIGVENDAFLEDDEVVERHLVGKFQTNQQLIPTIA